MYELLAGGPMDDTIRLILTKHCSIVSCIWICILRIFNLFEITGIIDCIWCRCVLDGGRESLMDANGLIFRNERRSNPQLLPPCSLTFVPNVRIAQSVRVIPCGGT